MPVLLDTNILLRLLNVADPLHAEVRTAVAILYGRGEELVMSAQSAAEFWNVCTRPAAARGGYGLSVGETDRRLGQLEALFALRFDSAASYAQWRSLVVACGVQGVQVHDARLAALMLANGIAQVLTYNGADFARYPGIVPLSPAGVVAAGP